MPTNKFNFKSKDEVLKVLEKFDKQTLIDYVVKNNKVSEVSFSLQHIFNPSESKLVDELVDKLSDIELKQQKQDEFKLDLEYYLKQKYEGDFKNLDSYKKEFLKEWDINQISFIWRDGENKQIYETLTINNITSDFSYMWEHLQDFENYYEGKSSVKYTGTIKQKGISIVDCYEESEALLNNEELER